MKQTVIKRLFESFGELERAIESAKKTLESKTEPPTEVLNRIKVYEDIVLKQRKLATELCAHATLGNWQEVSRHVQLINALSGMIRDDAREVLSGFKLPLNREQREATLS